MKVVCTRNGDVSFSSFYMNSGRAQIPSPQRAARLTVRLMSRLQSATIQLNGSWYDIASVQVLADPPQDVGRCSMFLERLLSRGVRALKSFRKSRCGTSGTKTISLLTATLHKRASTLFVRLTTPSRPYTSKGRRGPYVSR